MTRIGAVILAGGKSRLMGENKAFLTLDGKTFLDKISGELAGLDEILISVGADWRYEGRTFSAVIDFYPDCGPMGGIYSALSVTSSEYLLVVGCDMPFFQRELWAYMSAFVDDNYDAFVVVTRDGRLQPLCAIYTRRCAAVFQEQIKAGDMRLLGALDKLRVRQIPLQYSVFPDNMAKGIKTPEEYAAIRRTVPVIAVCGVKHSGKTTLLTGLIPCLKERGLRVAAIKHDDLDFIPDAKETDSHRLRVAGAYGVGMYSGSRYTVTSEKQGLTPGFFAGFFDRADLILLEVSKYTDYPQIEVVRSGISDRLLSQRRNLVALCADFNITIDEAPTLPHDDYDNIAARIISWLTSV